MSRALYKALLTALIFFLPWFAAGCDQSGRTATAPAGNSGARSAQQQKDRIDPGSSADAAHYSDLVKQWKPVTKPRRPYRLGAVMKYFGNPYYQLLADGMHAKADELGLFIYFQAGLTESDQEGQLATMEEAVRKGYDAILVSPQTDTNLIPAAKIARAKGIPLINVDDALLSEADYYIGPDQYENGVLAANYFIDVIGQGGKLAVIKGHAGDYGEERRTRGFENTLMGRSFQIVARPFCVGDLQIALQSAATIMSKHPDLKGFYCTNDTMALGVAQAVKQADKTGKVIVVGRDGIEPAYEAVRNGEMAATVDTYAFDMGKIAVELAVRILESQDVRRVVFTPQKLIAKANAAHSEEAN